MRKGLVKNILIGSIPMVILVGILLFIFLREPKRPPIRKDLPVQIHYKAEDGGTIEGSNNQIIDKGKDGKEVKAIPEIGYYFTGWSDGVTTPVRKEMNVQEEKNITAKFAIISDGVTATYKANELGWVNSKESVEYEVQRGTEGWKVLAVASSNAVFVKWSDGVTTPERQDKDIMESFEVTAIFGYSISYQAGEHGTIVGETEQVVTTHYGSTTEVTAVPDKGYTFIGWSDGITKATRQDRLVEGKKVTAYFEWVEDYDFIYHDNYATANCTEASVKLKRGENSGQTINVPIRDHFHFRGWYFDKEYQEQATDEYGKIIVEEVYNQPSRDLYAKWEPVEEDIVTYKILMVYVTEIDAVLKGRDGTYEQLHYRMSAEERAFCEELSKQYTEAVNDLLDGLVRFEVDSYYTLRPLTEECFDKDMGKDGGTDILADKIPELANSGMLDEYRSVITVYSLGQIKNLNPYYSGVAGVKYARVPYDKILDTSSAVGTCIHEFFHTIEQGMTCFEFHEVQNPYTSLGDFSEMIQFKLYALNQWTTALKEAKLDELREAWLIGEKLGIPYSAWKGDFCKVILKSECVNGSDQDPYGGYISYSNSEIGYTGWRQHNVNFQGQVVPKGSRTTILSVSSEQGFKFIGWSDGSMDTVRILTDVQEDMTLIAYFERLSYTVEYRAMEGGRIEGTLIQTALKGNLYQIVEAIPNEGYRFVGWSDKIGYGSVSLIARCDVAGGRYFDVETEEWTVKEYIIIYAIFEKIEEDSEK